MRLRFSFWSCCTSRITFCSRSWSAFIVASMRAFSSSGNCPNLSGVMTSPSVVGAIEKPIGVWMRAMFWAAASLPSDWKASCCCSDTSPSICSARLRYSSLSKRAGMDARASSRNWRTSLRKPAPAPCGSRSTCGRCGWAKFCT